MVDELGLHRTHVSGDEEAESVSLDRLFGQLPLDQQLRVASAICDALKALHERGVAHLELRPSTISVNLQSGRARLGPARSGLGTSDPISVRHENATGSFAYMAPERTGRLASEVDSRADLYSLGVVLYQLTTGMLPFAVNDPRDWFHVHLTIRPLPIPRHTSTPQAFEQILLKLLEKQPDDRYQTVSGLGHDLRECSRQLESTGVIRPFSLGLRDFTGQLTHHVPFRGRSSELDALYDRVTRAAGEARPELLLVAGASGMGKSSLIREVLARLPAGALIGMGKFDELEGDAPYATLMQAFRELCRCVLAGSADQLTEWKHDLLGALGANAGIATDLVPELETIVGPQPPPVQVPPPAARNLVYATLRRCLGVFVRRQRPLVLFMDDLQWLDLPSLDLLEHLLLAPELSAVMLIGAYRVESVAPEHPLRSALARLSAGGRVVQTVELAALSSAEVEELVADALTSPREATRELASIVETKTGGSPFFVRQFLTALTEKKLLWFDRERGSWAWDLPGIVAHGPTDNLADLLLERLARLPASTQHALEVLACLGVRTSAKRLAELSSVSLDELRESMRVALAASVIVQAGEHYGFAHDRLLTAAYSRIPENERASRHLALGRALRERFEGTADDRLLETVRQLNRARELLGDVSERVELAALNLERARRSRAAAAYPSALAHIEHAISLLPKDHWDSSPTLSFELYLARAEGRLLCAEHWQVEGMLNELVARDLSLEQRGAVVAQQLALYAATNRFVEAIDAALAYLRLAGVPWQAIDADELQRQYENLRRALGNRSVSSLEAAPVTSSPAVLRIIEVCSGVLPVAFYVNQRLLALLSMYVATLSIEHGNCDISIAAYAYLGQALGPYFGEYALGFEFGRLSSRLAERGSRFAACSWLLAGGTLEPRLLGAHAGFSWLARAADAADRFGDMVFGVYARTSLTASMLDAGVNLEDCQRQSAMALAFAERHRFAAIAGRERHYGWFIRGLREPGHERVLATGPAGDERDPAEPSVTAERYYFWIRRMQARYFAGDFAGARAAGRLAQPLTYTLTHLEQLPLWLFCALSEAANATADAPGEALERMKFGERELAGWAERGPTLFASKVALVAGERARLEGRGFEAVRSFERAAQLAREHDLIHEEALAHELAARVYADQGVPSVARTKLVEARACYLKWGAHAKVTQLEARIGDDEALGLPLAIALEQIDVKILISALQAVSSSLELDKLIDALLKGALQHAAAERGVLVLLASEPRIVAQATSQATAIEVARDERAMTSELIPETILRYVLNSGERVCSRDGAVPAMFRTDRYFAQHEVRSVLCLPIVLRTKVLGALYLENTLTKQVYTARDLALLELIVSQAGVSLENGQLYAGLRATEQRMVRAERASRAGSFSYWPDTRTVEFSEEIRKIFQMTGTPSLADFGARIHPEDKAVFDALVSDTARYDGKTVEHRLLLPDGTVKHVAVIASRLATNEFVGTIRDITESKQTELALERTQAALTDITRVASLGEMAAAIAHEVNQPIAGIGLNASACLRWLEEGRMNPAQAREAALRIRRDAERAGKVIHRLRALFSKTEAAVLPVDLNDAVSEVIQLSRSRIREAEATVKLELKAELPPVRGDRVQLQQVAINLLTNALDVMKGVSGRPRIVTVRTSLAEGARARCDFQDSGPGIAEGERGQIFRPFYTTKPDGMGIGLAISSNIVASHDGELSVSPNGNGPGSTFSFVLPLFTPTLEGAKA